MTRPDDEQIASRLRAADPAAEMSTDLDAVRAAVAARLAGEPGTVVPAVLLDDPQRAGVALPPEHVLTHGPAHRPAPEVQMATVVPLRRRRVRWVAAAAAALVVVTGGGYVVSTLADRTENRTDAGAATPTVDPDNEVWDDDWDEYAPNAQEAAPDGFSGSGPVRHVGVGLSQTGGTGTVYQVGPADVDAARLARAWDVPGPVRVDGAGRWVAAGGTRTLRVTPIDGLVRVELTDTAVTATSADVAAARRALQAAGVDLRDFQTTTSGAVVHLRQMVGGQPTTLGWQVEAGADGPRRIVGTIGGAITPLGQYALVSPADAVTRLDSTAFRGWSATMPHGQTTITGATGDGAPPAAAPGPPVPGDRLPWLVTTVQITSARLGLALDTSSGTALLVPAYALTSVDSTALVPALADAALARQ